jgi:hypothetical protein
MNDSRRSAVLQSIGIGLMSAATLGLEIALTNVFGVLLQYHYVSFIVSLAVFGIGVGAYAARDGKTRGGRLRSGAWICAAAGLYMGLVSVGLAKFPYLNQLVVYALMGSVPFLLFGWIMGRALSEGVAPVSSLYAADLFGAGIGVLAAYGLLHRLGGLMTVFALSSLCYVAALVFWFLERGTAAAGVVSGQRSRGLAAAALFGLLLLTVPSVAVFGIGSGIWKIDFTKLRGAAPDKTLVGTLQSDSQAHILHTEWDEFSRTDLVETSDPNRRILFVDGGAGSYMYRFDGNLNSVAGLARDIEFLPFAVGPAGKTIIVGSGGGRDILYTLLAGAKDVTAVELSPGLVRSVSQFGDYNGGILDRPEVRTVIGDGRTVLEQSAKSYDLIVLDLVYSQVGGLRGQALAENYVFTAEAFDTYFRRLSANGRIIVISHQGLEGIRAYYTGFDALLRESGLAPAEASKHTALIMAPEGSKAPNLTLAVLQKSTLSSKQLELLSAGTQSLGLNPLFLPGTNEVLLKPLLEGKVPFDTFVRDSDYNVYPTTDDRPFFFQLNPGVPSSLMDWLCVILGLTLGFIVYVWWREAAWPSGAKRSALRELSAFRWSSLAYFALLGVGYICIQFMIIQQTMVYAGSPVLAAAVVIAAMLLGGSAGSRFAASVRIPLPAAMLGIVVIAAGVAAAEASLGDALFALSLGGRMTLIGVAVFVLGALLGIPLPRGLTAEERRHDGSSPFYFAWNGIAGIWGSWLAAVLSVTGGLMLTLGIGCLCYMLASAVAWQQWRRTNDGQNEG